MRRASWLASWALCSALASPAAATDLSVGSPALATAEDGTVVTFSLAWRNAWRAGDRHDAAWVVLHDGDGEPLALHTRSRAEARGELPGQVRISDDGIGAFVSLSDDHRGDVSFRVSLPLAQAPDADAAVHVAALEMVLVAGGPFELGDDLPGLLELGAFHRLDEQGGVAGSYHVVDEGAVAIGSAPGQLHYRVEGHPDYRGDQQGPLPAAWPKGTRPFYVMKYELLQGQYAAFLRALPAACRARRVAGALRSDDDPEGWLVAGDDGLWVAVAPRRPANRLGWDDTAAFADWMGLRPLTEFEYERAARGPRRPTPGDFPWGTASREGLRRTVLDDRDLAFASADDEASLDDDSRMAHGASPEWVFDLSGSLWERVVSAGHPRGRAFTGSHGDGRLDPQTGRATNADWPSGEPDGRAADGIGYRGGAEYFSGEDGLTNPYSPVAGRTYAAWNGAFPAATYSARACRTAP